MDWYNDPARNCAEMNPDQFLPTRADGSFLPSHVKRLRAVCDGCVSLDLCRADALKGLRIGFQGGMTSREAIRTRTTRPQLCGTDAAYHRHLKAGEPICELCRLAHRAISAQRAKRRYLRAS